MTVSDFFLRKLFPALSMKIFCIDIGNTHTHCATVDEQFKAENSADFPSDSFAEAFERLKLFENSGAEAISWCSVVPRYSAAFQARARTIKNVFNLNFKTSPMRIDMHYPEQVGQDRIADALGAGIFFKPPYIVVDMGTAVTIDFVDKNGNYAGGSISPGMHAFTEYLCERAAQLPRIDPSKADYSLVIGKDTVEAMYVGCAKGFCKLAEGIIGDIEKEYFDGESAASKTVFTGGNIRFLPLSWIGGRRIEANLAQIGLARAYFLNKL